MTDRDKLGLSVVFRKTITKDSQHAIMKEWSKEMESIFKSSKKSAPSSSTIASAPAAKEYIDEVMATMFDIFQTESGKKQSPKSMKISPELDMKNSHTNSQASSTKLPLHKQSKQNRVHNLVPHLRFSDTSSSSGKSDTIHRAISHTKAIIDTWKSLLLDMAAEGTLYTVCSLETVMYLKHRYV